MILRHGLKSGSLLIGSGRSRL